ncbi:hypothetical protein [Enterococcus sp. ZJ1668]|uniref:hypothetical protein n=1 Tax=Enterococcus sp. ZJ1668 TaxID=2709402 RepID=UPI0013EB6A81|nr:hypothetical protein [Enterococcus sp. ZJ1668]
MIIPLEEAQKIDPAIEQRELDAYEQMIRQLSNNPFQNIYIRYKHLTFPDKSILLVSAPEGLRAGDTIQISGSRQNDGLTTILSIKDKTIETTVKEPFFDGSFFDAFLTKIEYPPDIRYGVEELIKYNQQMRTKIGIKSESIARMTITYDDRSTAETVDGFPIAKFNFLNKYKKMRWG